MQTYDLLVGDKPVQHITDSTPSLIAYVQYKLGYKWVL